MAPSTAPADRKEPAKDYYDLGTYSRPITTTSTRAQTWFDRGLVWLYAYNHEEAIVCFRNAPEADAECAIAHWGIAYAIGPNDNKPSEAFEPEEKPAALDQARAAVGAASRVAGVITPVERALVEAVAVRYPDDAFADAMRPEVLAARQAVVCSTPFLIGGRQGATFPWSTNRVRSAPVAGASAACALGRVEISYSPRTLRPRGSANALTHRGWRGYC